MEAFASQELVVRRVEGRAKGAHGVSAFGAGRSPFGRPPTPARGPSAPRTVSTPPEIRYNTCFSRPEAGPRLRVGAAGMVPLPIAAAPPRPAPAPDLSAHGLSNVGPVHAHLSAPALVERALARGEGTLTDSGALVALTGAHTGRSPKDRYLVF